VVIQTLRVIFQLSWRLNFTHCLERMDSHNIFPTSSN
jgi:hypothetical protein